ncbi:MAG: hypothetical protein RLZ25_1224 [Pseudomonadota bacterium]
MDLGQVSGNFLAINQFAVSNMSFVFKATLAFFIMLGVPTVAQSSTFQALANLPSSATGRTALVGGEYKAVIFTTPSNYTQVETIRLGLMNNTFGYTSSSFVLLTLFSVGNDGKPAGVLASTSQTLTLTDSNDLYTFAIPNWTLSPNTSYAIALSSDSTGVAWWRDSGSPTAYNDFSYGGFYRSSSGSSGPWTLPASAGNALEILVSDYVPVPTLDEVARFILGLFVLLILAWWHRSNEEERV